jgi:TolA-binding protein
MKYFVLIFFLILALMLPGCSGNKAAELYDTAGFEELQNNRELALRRYEEIIEKYPDSDYAGKAEERISQLRQK